MLISTATIAATCLALGQSFDSFHGNSGRNFLKLQLLLTYISVRVCVSRCAAAATTVCIETTTAATTTSTPPPKTIGVERRGRLLSSPRRRRRRRSSNLGTRGSRSYNAHTAEKWMESSLFSFLFFSLSSHLLLSLSLFVCLFVIYNAPPFPSFLPVTQVKRCHHPEGASFLYTQASAD